jgi:hypothetical protein
MAYAIIAGLDYDSPITEFNVRPQPGTQPNEVLFKVQKGPDKLEVLDVQPDNQGARRPDGAVYQWFQLRFLNGQTGWLRGHILTIEGDLTRFGYGTLNTPTYAYKLTRVALTVAPAPITPSAQPPTIESEVTPPTAASEVTISPPAPTPAAVPEPLPAPVPVPAPTAPAAPATDLCAGTVTAGRGARLRETPVSGRELTIVPFEAVVDVLDVRSILGEALRWVQVGYENLTGWTREDLLSFSGNCARFNLAVTSTTPARPIEFAEYTDTALYPVPMQHYRFVRGFTGHQPDHPGVDYGGDEGEPLLVGPVGGLVVAAEECVKCNVPGRPSTQLQGLGLGDPNVFADKEWNFGFGHYIIVRYLHHQLPQSTRQALAAIGRPGHHIYTMYAHLQHLGDVSVGTVLEPGQAFTACGNSGNSSGPHLHLELRADSSPSFRSWAAVRDGLVDPLIMFKR